MDSDQNPANTQPFVAESHPLETVAGLVHPHQLEVQDFSAYALIVDARPSHDFADDHIPAAVNLPVLSDAQYAEVEAHFHADRHHALLTGAGYARSNMAVHVPTVFAGVALGERVLVYGAGGDVRGSLCADAMREIGFVVDELLGGYENYRRWVGAGLALLPRLFMVRVLGGPSGCGQARLLQELSRQGQQVLDLAQLAAHGGSLLGAQSGRQQPAQPLFESLLLDALRHRDAWRPLWATAATTTLGTLQMPDELFEAIQRAPTFDIAAPMSERIKLWSEAHPQDAADPVSLVERLSLKSQLVSPVQLIDWGGLALAGQTESLVEQVLTCEDELVSTRSADAHSRHATPLARIQLESLESSAIAEVAAGLIAQPGG